VVVTDTAIEFVRVPVRRRHDLQEVEAVPELDISSARGCSTQMKRETEIMVRIQKTNHWDGGSAGRDSCVPMGLHHFWPATGANAAKPRGCDGPGRFNSKYDTPTTTGPVLRDRRSTQGVTTAPTSGDLARPGTSAPPSRRRSAQWSSRTKTTRWPSKFRQRPGDQLRHAERVSPNR